MLGRGCLPLSIGGKSAIRSFLTRTRRSFLQWEGGVSHLDPEVAPCRAKPLSLAAREPACPPMPRANQLLLACALNYLIPAILFLPYRWWSEKLRLHLEQDPGVLTPDVLSLGTPMTVVSCSDSSRPCSGLKSGCPVQQISRQQSSWCQASWR